MGRNGKVNYQVILDLRDEIEKSLTGKELYSFIDSCAKELAARLLAKVVKRTPVGVYSGEPYTCETKKAHKGNKVPGKTGGTLRRGWTGEKKQSASSFAQDLKVHHFGNTYVIEIVNPVEYASYVEFGHRTRGGKGWVEGHFMLTISEEELQRDAPRVLENKLKKKLGEIFI
ncbi:MAG: HK97 gp10 family phage protein [Clostridia bacterium]|nr:HK97 gp10 family phage protein [Clostridia bacterium]